MSNPKFPNLTPCRVPALVCRKWYYEEHVLRRAPRKPFVQPMAFGSAVHETLKGVFSPHLGTPPEARDIAALAGVAIDHQRYPDPTRRDADLARCIALAEAYRQQDTDTEDTIAVEVFVEVEIPGGTVRPLTLGAKFDRLLARQEAPHHLVIKDYKTGASGYTSLDGACLMLAIAKLRYREQYTGFSVEYDHLNDHGLAQRKTVGIPVVKPVWEDLKTRALRVYAATEFPAEPGEHCMRCPLRAECQPVLTVEMNELDELFE